jgi:uncharacterized protein YgbK (DUF1537 family)
VFDHLIERAAAATVEALAGGKSVVVHTCHDMQDNVESKQCSPRILGGVLGKIVLAAAEQYTLRRLCIAGGDTSSYVARQLGIEALEMIAPLAPGAPLCRVHAPGSPVDGAEVNVKGGQVGRPDYFASVKRGHVD